MSTDVAQLNIQVQSASVNQASQNLRGLEGQGRRTESSMAALTRTGAKLMAAYAAVHGGIAFVNDAVRSYAAFDKGLIGVSKTTDIVGASLGSLGSAIEAMSLRIPSTTTELLSIAQSAGQLGVSGAGNILKFTETVAMLGSATDLHGEAAATTLARLLNVTGETVDSVDVLGSVIVALGNNMAATESEIARMATEVALATVQFHLSSADASALGAAMRAMGVRAELGGSAVGRTMRAIDKSIRAGGKSIKYLSDITGIASKDLHRTFGDDAVGVFNAFVQGLGEAGDKGESVTDMLAEMGLKGEEILKVLPSMAENYEVLARATRIANYELKENTALSKEAEAAYKSLDAQMQMADNRADIAMADIGKTMAPTVLNAKVAWAQLVEVVGGAVRYMRDFNSATDAWFWGRVSTLDYLTQSFEATRNYAFETDELVLAKRRLANVESSSLSSCRSENELRERNLEILRDQVCALEDQKAAHDALIRQAQREILRAREQEYNYPARPDAVAPSVDDVRALGPTAKEIAGDKLAIEEWLVKEQINLIDNKHDRSLALLDIEMAERRKAAHGDVGLLGQLADVRYSKEVEINERARRDREENATTVQRALMTTTELEIARTEEKYAKLMLLAGDDAVAKVQLRQAMEDEIYNITHKAEVERLKELNNKSLELVKKFSGQKLAVKKNSLRAVYEITKKKLQENKKLYNDDRKRVRDIARLDVWYAKEQSKINRGILQDKIEYTDDFSEYFAARLALDSDVHLSELERQQQQWENFYDNVAGIATDASSGMKSMFSDIMFDSMKGDLQDFEQYWDNFLDSLTRSFTNSVADMAVSWVTSSFLDMGGSFLSGLMSYHTGSPAIEEDELIAKLQRGEMVVPAKQAETIRRAMSSGGEGISQDDYFNSIVGAVSVGVRSPERQAPSGNLFDNFQSARLGGAFYGRAASSTMGAVGRGMSNYSTVMSYGEKMTASGMDISSEELKGVAWDQARKGFVSSFIPSLVVGYGTDLIKQQMGVSKIGMGLDVPGRGHVGVDDIATTALSMFLGVPALTAQLVSPLVSLAFSALGDAFDMRSHETFRDAMEDRYGNMKGRAISEGVVEMASQMGLLSGDRAQDKGVRTASYVASMMSGLDMTTAGDFTKTGKVDSILDKMVRDFGRPAPAHMRTGPSLLDAYVYGYGVPYSGPTSGGSGGMSPLTGQGRSILGSYWGGHDAFGGGWGSSFGGGFSTAHTGGYLKRSLRADEGLIVAQSDEAVVSRPGMEFLDKIMRGEVPAIVGGQGGGDTHLTIQIVTEDGQTLMEQVIGSLRQASEAGRAVIHTKGVYVEPVT